MFCEVYLLDAPYALDRPFDYSLPEGLHPGRGDIVRVPFGFQDRLRQAVVLAVKEESRAEKIKPVHSILRPAQFDEEMLGLCLFLREHTLCTFGDAARCILPPGALREKLNISYRRSCILKISPDEAELLAGEGKGRLRSEGQREILRMLIPIGSADYDLVRALPGVTAAHIAALKNKGVIDVGYAEQVRNPYAAYAAERDRTEVALTRAQNTAYETIERLYLEDAARCALLHGITGSGKTKIIMKMIDRTLADGKTVIMLVPEIALTPQTVGIFCRRYGERVAVIHSALSEGERQDADRRIRRGEVDVVIGTRSAVFAPLAKIGMIVIDEEHEHTYKSDQDPKYHARDVAAYRCGVHRALLLLASATPSLESYYKAERGVYTLVPLKERYGGAKLPDAVIVDLREELRCGNTSPISHELEDRLRAVSERREQAILFLNRRGYNSQVTCRACGDALTCPRCSVALTYHTDKEGGRMLCHYCGYTAPVPRACPSCGGEKLAFLGFGTQKVEGELGSLFPELTLMRMDADTTGTKMAYDRMLEDFRAERADLLLGTQMVAKGHDFPKVTLVGVILADTSLYVSDFRANERTFSLLTQVIGRAGRASERGVAVIQTYSPQNEIIRLACAQDYESFYRGEIAIRRELAYPPFCDLVTLTLTSEDESALFGAARRLPELLKEKMAAPEYQSQPLVAFGPFEAGLYKINEKYRMRMVVKCRLSVSTRALFRSLLSDFSSDRKVTLSVDQNPNNSL